MSSWMRGSDKPGRTPLDFTEDKFKSLGAALQHKQCAALLRDIYDLLLEERDVQSHADIYHQLLEWMGLATLVSYEKKAIADLYHDHLKEAACKLREHNLLPRVTRSDRDYSAPTWPIAFYLDNLRSAHNVGSIIRTTEGFSLGTLYFSQKTPFTDNPQVQKASMGSAEWVVCRQTKDLSELPRPMIALETSLEATPLYEFIFPETFTLIVGNEEYGCSEEMLGQADYYITIPMRGRKNSFNVANAFSMVAYEIARQRSRQKDSK